MHGVLPLTEELLALDSCLEREHRLFKGKVPLWVGHNPVEGYTLKSIQAALFVLYGFFKKIKGSPRLGRWGRGESGGSSEKW